jgi:hypothetical protein
MTVRTDELKGIPLVEVISAVARLRILVDTEDAPASTLVTPCRATSAAERVE